MSAMAPVMHPLELSDSLLTHPQWCLGAAQLAALALAGPWYQLEFATTGPGQCIPYPPGPTRKVIWVANGPTGLRIKVAPRLVDPEPWRIPAPYLRKTFARALPLPARACAARVAAPAGLVGARVRVTLHDPATGQHHALFESRKADQS